MPLAEPAPDGRPTLPRRAVRALLALPLVVVLAVGGGFGWYARDAVRLSPWPARADGIVVLTGGALRIETAVALLRAGVADRMLISGVPRGIGLADLLAAADGPAASEPAVRDVLFAPADDGAGGRITLGHGAATTRGNAVETREWAESGGLHDLVVVTAGYHMRRALAELAAALPGARLHPYAVHPAGTGLRVLITEYGKFLLVEAGLVPPPRAADTV